MLEATTATVDFPSVPATSSQDVLCRQVPANAEGGFAGVRGASRPVWDFSGSIGVLSCSHRQTAPHRVLPDAIYHVMSRGNPRQKIFRDDRDYQRLLAGLEAVVGKFAWQVMRFVWMPNHFHL